MCDRVRSTRRTGRGPPIGPTAVHPSDRPRYTPATRFFPPAHHQKIQFFFSPSIYVKVSHFCRPPLDPRPPPEKIKNKTPKFPAPSIRNRIAPLNHPFFKVPGGALGSRRGSSAQDGVLQAEGWKRRSQQPVASSQGKKVNGTMETPNDFKCFKTPPKRCLI